MSVTRTVQTSPPVLRLALVAGELSGDTLGAGLLNQLASQGIQVEAVGVGGPAMQQAGLTSWWEAEDIAVMGLTEVVRHLPRLLRLKRELAKRIRAFQPHAFIGIDLPDFNLRLARSVRSDTCRTIQYVSPSVWAWRPGRVKTIAQAIDQVWCLLPFEPTFYRSHGVSARFVGHPLADRIVPINDHRNARTVLSIDHDRPVFALLPGSREGEVKSLAPVFLNAAKQLQKRHPNAEFVTRLAGSAAARTWREAVAANPSSPLVTECEGTAAEVMAASDVVILASGTVALEALLVGRPMVMAYRLSAFTAWIINRFNLMHVEHFSLPNLLTSEQGLGVFVPELVQDDAEPAKIAAAAHEQYMQRHDNARRDAFNAVREQLAVDANTKATEALLEILASVHSASLTPRASAPHEPSL
ncbi:MAG: lipid-A-disaccharide synthase [Pseudomonadota bacterium]